MPLNATLKKMLDALPSDFSFDVDHLPVKDGVAKLRGFPLRPIPVDDPVETEDRTIGCANAEIPIRIYRARGEGPFGLVMNYHGGGWTLGSIAHDDYACQQIAKRGFIVVSVEYRLAPEYPYPTPFDDCYGAALWVARHAKSLNARTDKIALHGNSAGANLAAAVALRARDSGDFNVAFQTLVCPVVDYTLDLPSHRDNATGYMTTTRSLAWFWDRYVPDRRDRNHPYIAPLRAPDLAGVAPALIVAAGYDPLRDEARAYADRLRAADVSAYYVCYEELIHGFVRMLPGAPEVEDLFDRMARGLRRAFGGTKQ